MLPLAISFFTCQQISFLLDTWKGDVTECDFPRYMLFVVFFPQLIAGPIVMQKETIPQFKLPVFKNKLVLNLAVGSTLFAIGLFKKIVLADGIAPYANSVFNMAETTSGVPFEAAWIGALAYTFQLYFDFSGYCDMALGLARLFGIRLPVNFNSPYKATSISDFWRRWHITLGAWVRDYVYFPLGGSRGSELRVSFNLMLTMLIIGLWHGANWLWVIFGLMQGVATVIERTYELRSGGKPAGSSRVRVALRWLLLMQFHALTYVCIRAQDMGEAKEILTVFGDERGWQDFPWYVWPALFGGIGIHFVPKAFYRRVHGVYLGMPTVLAGVSAGAVIGVAALLLLGETPFIYFQF